MTSCPIITMVTGDATIRSHASRGIAEADLTCLRNWTTKMEISTAKDIINIILTILSWISGVLLNCSIATAFFRKWTSHQCFNVCDTIFFTMSLINVLLQCFTTVNDLVYHYVVYVLFSKKLYILSFLINFSFIYGNFWLSAWLSIYYSLKLVKYSHRFLFWLQDTLSSYVVPILMITLLVMFLINLPFLWTIDIKVFVNKTAIHISGNNIAVIQGISYLIFNVMFGFCLPFLMSFICIGLSLASLLGHIRKVHQCASQYSSFPEMQGLLQAARTMGLQLTLNVALCVTFPTSIIIAIWNDFGSHPEGNRYVLSFCSSHDFDSG
ncbi:taste receptor type 2 member 40-like [Hyperolius riggenbachi]|uniref:taste receptor type 2 member 40-like n=1 Tax=Hyperolius riggenbachi TaxID=752182 RepID=UPI0035A33A14